MMTMMPLSFLVLLGAVVVTNMMTSTSSVVVVEASPLEDLVEELPMFGRTPTPHFSGYLDASPGCDTARNGPVCKLHYWLALSDPKVKDPLEAPVVLWLNGGPGKFFCHQYKLI